MNSKVWLIGGTSDSATIARMLAAETGSLVVTVATETAQALYSPTTEVVIGCMNQVAMQSFCLQHQIIAVVDASHPYAVEVSSQAIAVSTQLNIPYLRYERSNYQVSPVSNNAAVIELNSFEQLLAGDYLSQQRVLLTVGCKALPQFKSWQSRATLFARVLPKVASLKTALESGFTSDRIVAIRPPLSIAIETALWRQWNISLVVTKASGTAGGEDIKRQVAANLGISLIIVARPKIAYPQQTSILPEVLTFCQAAIIN